MHLRDVKLHAGSREALKAARKRIQIVFQDPYRSLDPRQRVVGETIIEGRSIWRAARAGDGARGS